MRRSLSFCLVLAAVGAVDVLGGCSGGVIQRMDAPPPAPAGEGWVKIDCKPADVSIYVDDAYRGQLDGYPQGLLRLPEGTRRITLSKSGYYAWHGAVSAGRDPARVETYLVPEVR